MDDPKEFQRMLDKAIKEETFAGFDRTKNVQEQLQEMVIDEKDSEGKYIVLLHDFLGWVLDDCTGWSSNPSIDQLWVAFVMHELHQKYWTENGWEIIKQEVSNEKS